MKKQLQILFVFFIVWAPLGAQTFEKIIPSPNTFDQLNLMTVDQNDNISVFIRSINYSDMPLYPLHLKPIITRIVQLDESGNQLMSRRITSNDFVLSLDASVASFSTSDGIYKDNEYLLSGLIRIDTPAVFANNIYVLDSNFNIQKYHIQDELVDEAAYIHRIKSFNDKYYVSGEIFNMLTTLSTGYFATVDDSLKITKTSLHSVVDSIYLTSPMEFLVDDQQQFYIFGEGLLPSGGFSDFQLVKLDSNLKLIKSKYISYPLLAYEYGYLDIGASLNGFWISDTTFLLAATGRTGMRRTGDIHLFVYDTSLQQKSYKRVISSTGTIAFNYTYKIAAYDSISGCFYIGSTRQFKGWNRGIFGTRDTTDFQLTKFDKDLNVVFQRNYRRNKTLTFNTLAIDSKGNVIMGGMIQDINYTNAFETDIFILKVDSLGNTANQPTGLNSYTEIDELNYRIYPNPSQGKLSFIQYNLQEEYEMKLYNSLGSLMATYTFKNADNYFDISNFPNGVYVYSLIDSKGRTASGKLIKQD